MSEHSRGPWGRDDTAPADGMGEEGATLDSTVSGWHAEGTPQAESILTILAHPDPRRVGERTVLLSLSAGAEVLLSRTELVFSHPGHPGHPDRTEPLPLGGRYLSRQPIRLRLAGGGTDDPGALVLDLSTTRIRVEVDGERVEQGCTLSSQQLEHGVVLLLARKVALWLQRRVLPREGTSAPPSYGLVGESPGLTRLRQEIRRLAPLDAPVLLRGETGTGKELVARALHRASDRRQQPYLVVNMGVLAPTLAASELFGAVRGAYTGADRQRPGFFRSAQGGTLFLDEIGEAPPEVQAMLLRVLESREIVPVGGATPVEVDVRVIAATDARLEEAMASDRFRAPLYHRLAAYTLGLPPLRERLDDLGRLLLFFLRQEQATLGEKTPTPDAGEPFWPPAEWVARLARHHWPGNVRELRNVARRLALGDSEGTWSDLEALLTASPVETTGREIKTPPRGEPPPDHSRPPIERTTRRVWRKPEEVAESELLQALREHRWQLQATAEALGVSRPNLYRMVRDCPAVRTAKELERGEIEAVVAASRGDLEAAAMALEVSLPGLKRRMKALGLALR